MRYSMTACAVALLVGAAASAQTDKGLVLWLTFDEGSGDVVKDKSGKGNHGKIHGAKFVKLGKGYALKFDGIDDYVDCGTGKAFDVTKAFTIEFWMLETGDVPMGEPPVMGKAWGIYLLTRCMGRLYGYMASGAVNCASAAIAPETWHHVVLTFQDKTFSLYVDGRLLCERTTKAEAVASRPHVPFWIGRVSNGRGAFEGLLDEVRFCNRGITAEEVREHYGSTGLGLGLCVRAIFLPTGEKLVVQADLRNVEGLPKGGFVRFEVRAGPKTVARKRITEIAGKEFVETKLDTAKWRPGKYEIRAFVLDGNGRKPVGTPATCTAKLRKADFPVTKAGYRRLNNLVVEMINLSNAEAERAKTHTFTLERDGWVFISTTAETPQGANMSVLLDSVSCIRHAAGEPKTQETMRFLLKGRHMITLNKEGKCEVKRIIVRSVPELAYHAMGMRSPKLDIGPYASFLKKHVYRNTNLYGLHRVNQADEPGTREIITEWRKDGRKFLSQGWRDIPSRKGLPVTGDSLYEYWSGQPGFRHPLLSGLFISELNGGAYGNTPAWLDAIERLSNNPEFRSRKLHIYGYGFYTTESGCQLMRKMMDYGHILSWERYLHEQPTEAHASFFLKQHLTSCAKRFNQRIPGSIGSITANIGIFKGVGDSCDWYPDVSQKTYFDMMINVIANDPQLLGLHGIQLYAAIGDYYPDTFIYTNEETIRWMSRLFRHYGIEGNTRMCSDDPYTMTHLRNGDFDHGTDGWTLLPAEAGSIKPSRFKNLGILEGRWPYGSEVGDTGLAMRRSKRKPNLIAQEICDLTPGRLYSIEMFSVDRENPKEKRAHALTIRIQNVELIPGKSFHRVLPNSHTSKDFPRGALMLNCYRTVFRAKAKTADLTISDWSDKDEPGGPAPAGQEVMFNFIQVQPYLEE